LLLLKSPGARACFFFSFAGKSFFPSKTLSSLSMKVVPFLRPNRILLAVFVLLAALLLLPGCASGSKAAAKPKLSQPIVTWVSSGNFLKGSDCGHSREEMLARLTNAGVRFRRTD
jgi:hypothetical protein